MKRWFWFIYIFIQIKLELSFQLVTVQSDPEYISFSNHSIGGLHNSSLNINAATSQELKEVFVRYDLYRAAYTTKPSATKYEKVMHETFSLCRLLSDQSGIEFSTLIYNVLIRSSAVVLPKRCPIKPVCKPWICFLFITRFVFPFFL